MKKISEMTLKEKAYEYGIAKPEIPKYIIDNLKHTFFDWQKEALENLILSNEIKTKDNPYAPTHAMFNMATGSGKTLLMAAAMLYYYKQGYRHFLFFVNRNNIVDKTENNFINTNHPKYLFTEKIVIDDITVPIKQVNTFSDYPQGIEIKFTSIQKLYNDIHIEKENQTTLDDLHTKDIVMLADEAHHLNTDTNKKYGTSYEIEFLKEIKDNASEVDIERKGWEHTVIELILNKNRKKDDNKNVLLEFTATIPDSEAIAKKYQDKIIYTYDLKTFLQEGYTKEINLISSTHNKKERVLHALFFQWYRHKISLKYNIANFKPVILFRSKTIEESQKDYEDFLDWTSNLSHKDFDFCKDMVSKIPKGQSIHEQGQSRTQHILDFIKTEKILFENIADWIKQSYQERNIIITNSKNKTAKGKRGGEKTTEEQDALINSLENKNNHIRALFTVDRLTEGWDVLNLFDIVRLYQGQNAGGTTKKTPEATTKEKQLIGRGVRYFPFTYKDKIINKRKFDNNLEHELRVLEELYYYTYDEESRYISHLKEELRRDGYIRDDRIMETFSLKEEFKETHFYKNAKVWYNEQQDNPKRQEKNIEIIRKNFSYTHNVKTLELTEEKMGFDKQKDIEKLHIGEENRKTLSKKFKDIEKHIFLKAMNIKAKSNNSLYQFEKLKNELGIASIEDLQKQNFLGNYTIDFIANTDYEHISNEEKLNAVKDFLETFFTELKNNITPKIGGEFISANFDKFFDTPKQKVIDENNRDENIPKDKWYVLDKFVGTGEEKGLIEFIKNTMKNLEEKYEEIYLLRNEEVYKIYDFEKGRGFQPDFLLFLKNKDIHYQIFIEPKQGKYMTSEDEKWKEDFLKAITEKYGLDKIIKAEDPNYKLIGLPFYNQQRKENFQNAYNTFVLQNQG